MWLNNPRRPLEASGTSGQKVVLNGGLNLSVLDGWWAEAYDGPNGFAIGTGRTHTNMDIHDKRDAEDLNRVLREEVIPLYYERDRRRPAARLDPADETNHPHARLAFQRRPHGDGLHAESLHSRGRRNFERYVPGGITRIALIARAWRLRRLSSKSRVSPARVIQSAFGPQIRKRRTLLPVTETQTLEDLCINTIRILSADAVQNANSGHPGMPMGAAAMAYTLWTNFLKYNPKDPALVRSRPLRPLRRTRLDAALQPAASHRLRSAAR